MNGLDRAVAISKGVGRAVFKRSIYTAGVLVSTLALIQLFYAVVPGWALLSYERAAVTSAIAGDDVAVTLCRDRRIGSVQATAVRTFYRADTRSGDYRSVGQYQFTPEIEDGERCIEALIRSTRFNHTEGYYKFHTDLRFAVHGYEKSTGYDSDVYRIFPRPTNAELQLQLELRIDDLQRQLDELKLSASRINGSPATAAVDTEGTARTDTPTTSAPPEQPVQQQPSVRRPVQPALNAVDGVLQSISELEVI